MENPYKRFRIVRLLISLLIVVIFAVVFFVVFRDPGAFDKLFGSFELSGNTQEFISDAEDGVELNEDRALKSFYGEKPFGKIARYGNTVPVYWFIVEEEVRFSALRFDWDTIGVGNPSGKSAMLVNHDTSDVISETISNEFWTTFQASTSEPIVLMPGRYRLELPLENIGLSQTVSVRMSNLETAYNFKRNKSFVQDNRGKVIPYLEFVTLTK